MKSLQRVTHYCQHLTSFRRHSECLPASTSFRPTYQRSISDGAIPCRSLRTHRHIDRRVHTRRHLKGCKKSESARHLDSVFNSVISNESTPENEMNTLSSESNVQCINASTLDVFEHCLFYKEKTTNLWSDRVLCAINLNHIIAYLVTLCIIGFCVIYDIRLCYIILHLWIISGVLKDVQNINDFPEKDKKDFWEKTFIKHNFNTIHEKSFSYWNVNNLSWLWEVQPRRVSIEVFPSSLNLYFQNYENTNASESMNIEWLRLQSFAGQRSITVRPIRLASAGFYYTGTSDEVRCYSCGKRRSNWLVGEDPSEIHRQISPGCRHMNGTDGTNVAIPRENNHTLSSESPVAAPHLQGRSDDEGYSENRSNGACREHHRHPYRQSRNADTYQENPSLEQYPNVPIPVPQTRHPGPNVTNNAIGSTRENMFNASTTHRNMEGRTQQQANGHSFEQVRVSNGHNPDIGSQTNANISSGLNQPYRRSAINPHRNNTGSASSCGAVSDSAVKKLAPLGVNFDKPKYPAYAVLTVRMSSFKGWTGSQTPNLMSEAGFVYAGYADYTRCFFCGVGLKNWEAEDDPWVEHAKWFPNCAYLRQNKGDAFIRLVHERMDAQNQENDKVSDKSAQGKVCYSPTVEELSDKEVDDLPAFQSVVEEGYSPDLARQIIRQLWAKGVSNVSSMDILKEIFRVTEGGENTDDRTLENTYREGIPDTNSDDSEDREIRRLVEENRRLKREKMCRICEEEDASIAFLPCAHLVCCDVCAQSVRRCPVCMVIIQGTVKTWLT